MVSNLLSKSHSNRKTSFYEFLFCNNLFLKLKFPMIRIDLINDTHTWQHRIPIQTHNTHLIIHKLMIITKNNAVLIMSHVVVSIYLFISCIFCQNDFRSIISWITIIVHTLQLIQHYYDNFFFQCWFDLVLKVSIISAYFLQTMSIKTPTMATTRDIKI